MTTPGDLHGGDGSTPALGRVVVALLLVTPIRIALACAVLAAARLAGAASTAAMLAFVTLAFGTLVVIANDPRRRFWRSRQGAALPVPPGVRFLTRVQLVRSAVVPSTVGVTALATASIGFGNDTMAAALGGVLAGLGLASLATGLDLLVQERRGGREFYVEQAGHRVFERLR